MKAVKRLFFAMMTHKLLYIFLVFTAAMQGAFLQAQTKKAFWVVSTEQAQWIKTNVRTAFFDINDATADVEILLNRKQQTILGWGGCFNELGWDALNVLPRERRDSVLNLFFGAKEGLKYNLCRMPIGASDYARNWYSLNESPGDFTMQQFSLKRDEEALLPYIKAAKAINPTLQVWGSAWSPPSWMKTNGHYACFADKVNDLQPDKNVPKGQNQLIQTPEYLKAYALYLEKYVKAYTQKGVPISAIHVQNEPFACQNFPSCVWQASAMANFVSNYLGPKFKQSGLNTGIWYGTINNGDIKVFDTVLQNKAANKYISGVGVQWDGKNAVATLHQKYPSLKLMQTETECGNGTFDWKAANYTFGLMKHYFNNGVSAYIYWNMVLNETGKSQWGWKQNAQVVVNSKTKAVLFTPEYYLFKHFSHYIPAGSVKLATNGAFTDILAFETPSHQKVLVMANTSPLSKQVVIKINKQKLQVNLQANSFNTIIL